MKSVSSKRSTWLRASVATFACAFTICTTFAHASTPGYRPTDNAQIILRLGDGATEATLSRLQAAIRHAPSDVDALLRYVEALIAVGAATGSERHYGFAEQAIAGATTAHDERVLLLRAQLLQHRHEFRDAERTLGELLARDPRHREALLMRAQTRLHLHEPDKALRDCATLVGLVDLLTSSTCTVQARAALGELDRAYALLNSLLQISPATNATRGWAAGIAAELAARLGKDAEATQWYRTAFKLDARNHYARIVYADWLLAHGNNAEAHDVASSGNAATDLLRVVLAKQSGTSSDAKRLQLLWQEAGERGERAYLRDRARFELAVLRNDAQAHATALDNFRDHREPEDALLLAQTSAARRDAAGLTAVREWRATYHYVDARLDSYLASR